jgi:hypothetical protein
MPEGGEVDTLQIVINALVVSAIGVILTALTQGLRREVRQTVGELRSELGEFRAEVRSEFHDVRSDIREIRSDLTRVALAVGAERRAGNT